MQVPIGAKDNFDFFGDLIEKISLFYDDVADRDRFWQLLSVLFFFSIFPKLFSKIRKAAKGFGRGHEEIGNSRKSTLERSENLKRELIDAQMGKNPKVFFSNLSM